MDILDMYIAQEMSIPEISKITGIPKSNIRCLLKKHNALRSRIDAIRLASKNGKLGAGNRGKKRVFTEAHKKNISKGKLLHADKTAKGVRKTTAGYLEYTRGEHKGRHVHVVIIERIIGRRIFAHESVHHIDHNKENNAIENLLLCTRSEHSRLHAMENYPKRERKANGQFK